MKTVLVVDDSSTMRQQVGMALRGAGFEVIEAVDGVDGVSKLKSTPQISLVICDVNMPRMNGIDMVAQVKAEPQFADLPIVMLTTEGNPSLIAQAKEAGAKGWLVKPFKPPMLIATAEKLTA